MISRREAMTALAGMLPGAEQPAAAEADPKDKGLSSLLDLVRKLEGELEKLRLTSPPIGSVQAFAGEWPPFKEDGKTRWHELDVGWLLCDGRKIKDVEEELHREMKTRKDEKGQELKPPKEGILAQLRAVLPRIHTPAGDVLAVALPDYRGMFLRGVDRGMDGDTSGRDKDHNKEKPRSVGSLQDCTTKRPKNKKFTTDEDEGHVHELNLEMTASRNANGKVNNTVTSGPKSESHKTSKDGKHKHTITGGGDDETRPINTAVYYIIKFQ